MMERTPPPSLHDLDTRLREARERREQNTVEGGGSQSSLKGAPLAFRIGAELVAATVVGVGIGLLTDYWLDTAPWGMIVFFFLGGAAGILNVWRAVSGIGMAAGYQAPDEHNDVQNEGEQDKDEGQE
ncbi:MAG: AtpZ/AtpI family protein [Alphaproteobacteria bacterium]|nr:AtpZ/AtpI family protein [Alphaproteobacteria bacterium]